MNIENVTLTIPTNLLNRVRTSAKAVGQTLDSFTIMAWYSILEADGPSSTGGDSKISKSAQNNTPFADIHHDKYNWEMLPIVKGERVIPLAGLLWGQFHRHLPAKFTLRILADLLQENETDRIELHKWAMKVRTLSHNAWTLLRNADLEYQKKRGTQLASGFPNPTIGEKDDDKIRKSLDRFMNHFTAIVQDDGNGKVTGLCAEMGFINIINIEGESLVGLTKAGVDFCQIPSPIFDSEKIGKSALSDDEILFLIQHMQSNLQDDWGLMIRILEWIEAGYNTPNALDEMMEQHYGPQTKWKFSESEYPSYKGGALGRLTELGMLGRRWENRSVRYVVTDKARRIMLEDLR